MVQTFQPQTAQYLFSAQDKMEEAWDEATEESELSNKLNFSGPVFFFCKKNRESGKNV